MRERSRRTAAEARAVERYLVTLATPR